MSNIHPSDPSPYVTNLNDPRSRANYSGDKEEDLYASVPKLSESYKINLLDKAPNFLQIIAAKIMQIWARIKNHFPSDYVQKTLDYHTILESYVAAKKIEDIAKSSTKPPDGSLT